MKKTVMALAVISVLGASQFVQAENAEKRDNAPMVNSGSDKANPQNYPADNSGRNARDANDAAVTSGDQSNAKADVEITQAIRKAVTSDDSLSVNAHNVKIITAGGIVTLRGPVNDEKERANIAAKAQSVPGVTRVNNQLEVAAQ